MLVGILASVDRGIDISAMRVGDQIDVQVGDSCLSMSVDDAVDLLVRQIEDFGGTEAAIDVIVEGAEGLRDLSFSPLGGSSE